MVVWFDEIMDREEKLNSIRDRCIEANPDIISLGFGCNVLWGNGSFVMVGWAGGGRDIFVERFEGGYPKNYIISREEIQSDRTFEILGRHVRLGDVLLAQNNAFPFNAGYMGKMTDTVLRWNLRADDLREQSDETVNFLYELLK